LRLVCSAGFVPPANEALLGVTKLVIRHSALLTLRSKSGRKKNVDKIRKKEDNILKGGAMKRELKKKYNLTFTPSVYEAYQKMVTENGLKVSAILEMQMKIMLNAKKGVFQVFDGIYEMGQKDAKKELQGKTKK